MDGFWGDDGVTVRGYLWFVRRCPDVYFPVEGVSSDERISVRDRSFVVVSEGSIVR